MNFSPGRRAGFGLPASRLAVLCAAALIVTAITAGMAGAYGRGHKNPCDPSMGYTGWGYEGTAACSDAVAHTDLPPIASFSPAEATVGSTTFTATAYDPRHSGNEVTKYEWDFDNDGQVDAQGAVASRNFPTAGDADVKLVATFADGRKATSLRRFGVSVDHPPKVNISPSGGVQGTPTQLRVSGSDEDDWQVQPTRVTWRWGDGSAPQTVDAAEWGETTTAHTFAKAGRYRVESSILFSNGATATDVAYISINSPYVPAATLDLPQGGSVEDVAQYFTGNATGGAVTGWAWDFGDGTAAATTQAPQHTFAAPGEYLVKLTVTFANGATATDQGRVTIRANIAGQSYGSSLPREGVQGSEVNFSAWSSTPGGTYAWNFGDGGVASGSSATHVFAEPGNYDVRVTHGAETVVRTFRVLPNLPLRVNTGADWSARYTPGQPAQFDASVSDPHTSMFLTATAWHWDFGDGSESTIKNPTHTWTAPGDYDLRLTLTTSDGRTGEWRDIIEVEDTTVSAGFGVAGSRRPQGEVRFDAWASPKPTSYAWDFGDGTTGTGEKPTHAYATAGFKRVELTATMPDGGQLTAYEWVEIVPTIAGDAGIGWWPDAPAGNRFVDLAGAVVLTQDDPSPVSWAWDFDGDGTFDQTTTVDHVSHRFAVGAHTIRLQARFANGSTRSGARVLSVAPLAAGVEQVSSAVEAGDTVSTGTDATAADPVVVSVKVPAAGTVTISEQPLSGTEHSGYDYFGSRVWIQAPAAVDDDYLELTFIADASVVPAGTTAADIVAVRNGAIVGKLCSDPDATPWLCLLSREILPNGDARVVVQTYAASAWNLAVPAKQDPQPPGGGGTPTTGDGTPTTGGGTPTTGGGTPTTGGGGTATVTRPTVTAAIAKQKLAAVLKKGLAVKAKCSAACTLKVKLTLDKRTAKKLKLSPTLGTAKVTMTAAGTKLVTIKLSKAAAAKLKKLRSAKLTVVLDGGSAPVSRTVTIKR